MKAQCLNQRTGAFTLIELLCVIAIISIIAALLLPTLEGGKARVKRVACVNNLRQVGLGFQMFLHDHDNQFPMTVPLANGGSQEFVQSGYAAGGEFYFAYRQFQLLSNELVMPAILICPADMRWAAINFGVLQNSNLSYCVGVKAQFANPDSVLAGDRNLTANYFPNPSILHGDVTNRFWWTWELHQHKGNFLFADGRVEEWNNHMLIVNAVESLDGADFFLPSVIQPVVFPVSGHPDNPDYSRPGPGYVSPPASAPVAYRENYPAASPVASGQSQPRQPTVVTARPQNLSVVTDTNSADFDSFPTNAPVTATNAPIESDSEQCTFDESVVLVLRRFLIGTYLLVLSLFLLLLAYRVWRRWQRQKEKGQGEGEEEPGEGEH